MKHVLELCRFMDFSFPIADKKPRYALASVGQIRLTIADTKSCMVLFLRTDFYLDACCLNG